MRRVGDATRRDRLECGCADNDTAGRVHSANRGCHPVSQCPYNPRPVTSSRSERLEAWCREQTLGPFRLRALPVEASTRRFYRVSPVTETSHISAASDAQTVIAMDAPPETEDNEQFIRLSKLFRVHGIQVPEVIAHDAELGFLLVTDFGDRLFANAYIEGDRDLALQAAITALVRIQQIESDDVPPFEVSRFFEEVGIFEEWLIEGLLELDTPALFADVCRILVDATQSQPQVTVHRDYHSRNLLLLDDGSIGIVDFQDALVGPITYDLVSLLRDCYAEFDPGTVARWQRAYLAASGTPTEGFQRAFDLTGIQRHLKAVGIFARLKLRDGRSSHLADITPVLRRIAAAANSHPDIAHLGRWITDEVAPAAQRVIGGARTQ